MPASPWTRRAFAALALALILLVPARALADPLRGAADAAATEAGNEMTAGKAVILGLVEGVTEYLPISSTGHLVVTQRLLGIGTTDETKDAADSYAIAIQAGAILAVLFLCFGRIRRMAEGIVGRDEGGRRTLVALVLAFIPAAIVGVIGEKAIKEHLLGVGPVIIAWVVGGVFILLVAKRFTEKAGGATLDQITSRQALIIGVAQILALWPGTSRSMVTIFAALFVGVSLSAAVEFSFLLGLVTLGAATGYETLKNGSQMLDAYGLVDPLIGLAVAFVAAMVAVRWMVTYLQKHDLSIFGWYRIGIAAVAAVLLATGAI